MSENETQSERIKRGIRSFVVRSGRMTVGQQKGWDDHWSEMGLEPTIGRMDFKEIFGNDNPVVFEIGFGMGGSLVEMAKNAPELNFIGVEVHRPGVGALLANSAAEGLTNVRVFCCDANEVIDQCLPNGSLHRIQLYFPDPWHKKRHHKRRLVQPAFAQRMREKLAIGGVFHMATDWENYAEHMLEVMDVAEGYKNQAGQGNYSETPEYRPLTKFENRGKRLGHGVWDLLFERVD